VPSVVIDHRSRTCPNCAHRLGAGLAAEEIGSIDAIDLPAFAPVVTRHQRLAVVCPGCRRRVKAPLPCAASDMPPGQKLHGRALRSSPALTLAATMVRDEMDSHRPKHWLSDRYSDQQGHADHQQTCPAHLARDLKGLKPARPAVRRRRLERDPCARRSSSAKSPMATAQSGPPKSKQPSAS
jgi:hypothetical protein